MPFCIPLGYPSGSGFGLFVISLSVFLFWWKNLHFCFRENSLLIRYYTEVKSFKCIISLLLTFKLIGKITYWKSQLEFPLCSTQKSKNINAVMTVIHLLKYTSCLLLVWYKFRVVFYINHVSEAFYFPCRKLRFDFFGCFLKTYIKNSMLLNHWKFSKHILVRVFANNVGV